MGPREAQPSVAETATWNASMRSWEGVCCTPVGAALSPVQIGVLIVAIVVPQVLLLVLATRWVKQRSAQLVGALNAELAAKGELATRPPEPGLYRGASGARSRVKGNGVIVLTQRRVVFRKIFGADVEVPLADLVGVREDKWFLRAYTGGRLHMILQLKGGDEVGFIVTDHADWMALLRARIPVASTG